MARSFLETGRPTIRGADAVFPSLLQPIITAPTWLASDVWVSYRLTQAIGAVVMSLVAAPVFVLARKLGLGRPMALVAAALSLAVPDLLFASWVMAEPFAYPLFVASVLAGSVAIAEPRRRNGVAFVALAGLTAFARAQFAVLPFCFAAAVLIVGLRERRLRATLREQALPLGIFGAAACSSPWPGWSACSASTAGARRPRRSRRARGADRAQRDRARVFVRLDPRARRAARSRARARAPTLQARARVRRPLPDDDRSGAPRVRPRRRIDQAQERYVFYVLPLAVLAFCAYAARGWPARTQLALIVSLLIAASAQVPLAGFTAAEGKSQSPFLIAAFRLEEAVGSPGSGSLLIAGAAAVFGVVLILLSAHPAVGTPVALALALVATTAASIGAVAFDSRNADGAPPTSRTSRRGSTGRRRGRDDGARARGRPDRGDGAAVLEPLDPSRRAAPRRGRGRPLFLSPADGRRTPAQGQSIEGPVLVDGYGGTIALSGAKVLAASQSYTLWRPNVAGAALPRRALQRRLAGRCGPMRPLAGAPRRRQSPSGSP